MQFCTKIFIHLDTFVLLCCICCCPNIRLCPEVCTKSVYVFADKSKNLLLCKLRTKTNVDRRRHSVWHHMNTQVDQNLDAGVKKVLFWHIPKSVTTVNIFHMTGVSESLY